jgi:predicted PurR-regulated permease PerM
LSADARGVSRPLAGAAELSLRLLLVAGAIAVIVFVLVQLRLVVLPVLGALLLATVLVPPAGWLQRRGWAPALAALAVMGGAAALLAGIGALVVPTVAAELDDVGRSAGQGLDELLEWAAGPLGLSQGETERTLDRALERAQASGGTLAGGLVSGAILIAEVIAGLLLAIVLLFFFVKDGERIWSWVVGLLPEGRRGTAEEVGRRSWAVIGAYVRGLGIVASFDALLIGLALVVIGVPLVVPLMVLTFFSAFIPLLGAVVAGSVAALVALVAVGPLAALLVLGAIVVVQQVEGDVVYPLVVGRALDLHPVAILLTVTGGAVLAGVVGVLLAVPAAAVAWTVVTYLRSGAGQEAVPSPQPTDRAR